LTASQIVANSIAVDPVQVIGVDVADLDENGALGQIADGTGGSVVSSTSELTDTILEILDSTAKQPFAWFGQAYSGKIGEEIQFDASGSYDPSGMQITLYEWDFDSDGEFDLETEDAAVTHVYDTAFDDFVVLRVTSPGGSALASARTVVNAEGFVSQGDEESCGLDVNGYSIIVDEDGIFIPCTADSLPDEDQEGVREITDESDILPIPSAGPKFSNRSPFSGGLGILIIILVFVFGVVFIFYAKNKQPKTGVYLQVVNNPAFRSKIALKDNFIIGRGSASNLRLTDASVSRRHAHIRYAEGAWFIQDLGSAGGILVNGQRVKATRLNNGDQITIGITTLIFTQ